MAAQSSGVRGVAVDAVVAATGGKQALVVEEEIFRSWFDLDSASGRAWVFLSGPLPTEEGGPAARIGLRAPIQHFLADDQRPL